MIAGRCADFLNVGRQTLVKFAKTTRHVGIFDTKPARSAYITSEGEAHISLELTIQ